MDRLMALGLRKVPILARGRDYVFAVDLDAVAKFVGLKDTGLTRLPPEVLVQRLVAILRTAQSVIGQIPDDKLNQDAVRNRKRDLRLLSHHVFRIGEAWLEVAIDGAPFTKGIGEKQLADDEFRTTGEVVRYGNGVIARIEQWWKDVEKADSRAYFARSNDAYFGKADLHMLLERSTWHPAQHTRQLTSVLEGWNIPVKQRLTPQVLDGLPLPERLWE